MLPERFCSHKLRAIKKQPKLLRFELSCFTYESPEQYIAVFQGQQIGYLRLRHGEFRVDYPDCGDETILYSQEPQGDGCFEEDEREYFLMKAKKAIVKKFNEMEG